MNRSRPNPGPSTPPPPPGPSKPGKGTAMTPARQDIPLAAVGPDEPATDLDRQLDEAFGPVDIWWIDPDGQLPPLPLSEFTGGSLVYRAGRWSA
jgi:hypothetical protein